MKSFIHMKILSHIYLFLLLLLLFILSSCENEEGHQMFRHLGSEQTGITFANNVAPSDSFDSESAPFIYNGAATAAGDINNDGLVDLFFSGNMVSSRLYLNKGNFQFEDITESAGIATERWTAGASMVDINSDGFLDIYVSVSHGGWVKPEERENLLFINNGDSTFTEKASEYGLNDIGFTTHTAFLDYDRDGDLDAYLLTNSPDEFSRGETGMLPMGGFSSKSDSAGFDRLYRNNGDGTFTNVTEEAGIVQELGYGLGVGVSDLNKDGWPDIYVSNDISPNDVLYINNRDGTFTDRAADWFDHTSYAGMGTDIADFTNNGWPDILQSDMMPEELSGRKRMSGSVSYSVYQAQNRQGYFPHFTKNSLQMNHGVTDQGDVVFSEISRLAGISYTNWSWTSLFADLDNDGLKDIFITNGYPKAMNDFDYLSDLHAAGQAASSREEAEAKKREVLQNLPEYRVHNHLFRNNGDLTFTNMSESWGMVEPTFSYGSAYADLNNDGRLDLVINNINSQAMVYQNIPPQENPPHYLMVRLQGDAPNVQGIGARIRLWVNGQQQYKYQNIYRGFMSSVDSRLHFGLGQATLADSLRVTWPDGRTQLLTDIEADQVITVHQHQASSTESFSTNKPPSTERFFEPVSAEKSLAHKHLANAFIDFSVQPLLPYLISRTGPPIAAGDINDDGLEDIYIGGSAGEAGVLFIQQPDGRFTESTQSQPWQADSEQGDWDALFFDANGDGRLDLYVASGSYQTSPISQLLQDRLYINYGNGRFLKDTEILPQILTSTGTVKAGDFTGDGRPDLFVGGRLTPRDYPTPTRSYLLRNDGDRFTDVTRQIAPEMAESFGMVTDAEWIDYNKDGQMDLAVAGEWMSVQFFQNEGGNLNNVTESMELPPMRGWWYSLQAGDFNGDGQTDLAAGNLGLNHTYTTSEENKFGIVAGDFSGNRTTDIILTKQVDGVEYPLYGLAKIGRDIYTIALRFDSFESFSTATIEQVVGAQAMEQAQHYYTDTFASGWLENNGDGTFAFHPFPSFAQISPINDMIATDVDKDGNLDLIVAGNRYETEPTAPRADAGKGLWLKGDGEGGFKPIPPLTSGLLAPLDVRDLALINQTKTPLLFVTNNNDSTQVFRMNHPK